MRAVLGAWRALLAERARRHATASGWASCRAATCSCASARAPRPPRSTSTAWRETRAPRRWSAASGWPRRGDDDEAGRERARRGRRSVSLPVLAVRVDRRRQREPRSRPCASASSRARPRSCAATSAACRPASTSSICSSRSCTTRASRSTDAAADGCARRAAQQPGVRRSAARVVGVAVAEDRAGRDQRALLRRDRLRVTRCATSTSRASPTAPSATPPTIAAIPSAAAGGSRTRRCAPSSSRPTVTSRRAPGWHDIPDRSALIVGRRPAADDLVAVRVAYRRCRQRRPGGGGAPPIGDFGRRR